MKGYMTLVEAAEKWNVSARSINNYCIKGRIDGAERAGRLWMIPEDTEKPKDLRIKSGYYVGWRKKHAQESINS